MPISIQECDWKVFRRIREVALHRYCERVIADAKRVTEDRSLSMLDRYYKLFSLMQERDETLASAFDNPRRSTALMQIGIIQSMELWTSD